MLKFIRKKKPAGIARNTLRNESYKGGLVHQVLNHTISSHNENRVLLPQE